MCAIVKISTALKTEVIDLLFVNISTCFGCVFVIYIYICIHLVEQTINITAGKGSSNDYAEN